MPLVRPSLDQETIDLLALAMYPDPVRIQQTLDAYWNNSEWEVLGWTEANRLVCAAGIRLSGNEAELLHIGTCPDQGRKGYARSLIQAIAQARALNVIWAETDDESVEFYRRSGFVCQEIPSRWGNRRYRCEWQPGQCKGT